MKHHIIHDTVFHYDALVTESIMEVRLRPRDDEQQRCQQFNLSITPKTVVHEFVDSLGNHIHHFDVPAPHQSLLVRAESVVEVWIPNPRPTTLPIDSWQTLNALRTTPLLDMLLPSTFAIASSYLLAFMQQYAFTRESDPLTTIDRIARTLYETITYTPQSTSVDSPIDVVLEQRKGVCQDIAHVMIAICRQLGIPARYVSGYLYHRRDDNDRSQADATHAWVEAWIPTIGWVGIDPTNNIWTGERHIRMAIGRDYADVPPTRGVYRGNASERLEVAVNVNDADNVTRSPAPARLVWPSVVRQQTSQAMQQQQQQQ
ncbi:MAG: transglutaminase family protein [Chloroflexi bacterium]|nr:MAG: transglutaminase family protein [Chloroflexota bacterium]